MGKCVIRGWGEGVEGGRRGQERMGEQGGQKEGGGRMGVGEIRGAGQGMQEWRECVCRDA